MFAANVLSALIASAPIQTDCLFILAHAGETNDLLPVMEEMQKQERDFRVLPLGISNHLIKQKVDARHILKAEDYDVAIENQWPIDRELMQEKIDNVVDNVQAKVVVTGVAMLPQKQFLRAYHERAKTFAYWDNPEPRGGILYFSVALKVQAEAERAFFPSQFVAAAEEFKSRETDEKIVIGKPALLPFLNDLHSIDQKNVLQKLNFNNDRPIITFIGTYGERYEKAFDLFVQSLKKETINPPQLIFQMHPMATGEFETKCLHKQHGVNFSYVISPKDSEHGVTLLEAIAVADHVATFNSSAGFQALLGQKPVIYIVPFQDTYSNSLIEQGFASKASTAEQIHNLLFAASQKMPLQDFVHQMQIPLNPVERFLEAIDAVIEHAHVN